MIISNVEEVVNMAGKRITSGMMYSVVGRYMNGQEVIGYHIVGEDASQAKVTKEQLIFLIAKGVILNCRVQMLNGKPLLRGKGINISELPVVDEKTGKLRDTTGNENTSQRATKKPALGRLGIIGRIMNGSKCIGYIVRDSGGVERKLSRETIIELCRKKLISNATIQMYKGAVLIRGVGVDLSALPSIKVEKN